MGLDFTREGTAMSRLFSRYLVAATILACTLALVGCRAGDKAEPGGPAAGVPAAKGVAVVVPEPLDIASDKVMACVIISDLEASIDHIEEIAAAFAPEQAQPGMLKSQLETMVNDPGLIYLDDVMPLVLMVLKTDKTNEPPPTVLFMRHAADQPYEEAAKRAGMVTKVVDRVLALARTADVLDMAEQLVPVYRNIASEDVKSDLRLSLDINSLMEVYGSTIQAQVDTMVETIGGLAAMGQPGASPDQTAQMAKILKLEAKALLLLLADIELIQLDLNLAADAIAIDEIVVAKAGTALADLLDGPPVGENRALGILSEPGFMTYAIQLDPKGSSEFVLHFINQLKEDPDAAEFLTPELVELYGGMDEWTGSEMAFAMRATDDLPFTMESVTSIVDEAKYLDVVEQGISLLAPGSGLGNMYKEMGMEFSMALEKDVRTHAGVAVHRMKMDLNMPNVPEAEAAPIKRMMKDVEMAFARGYYLSSQDPASLDKMIDKALAGAKAEDVTLRAREVFGAGQRAYFDLDFIGLMKAAMEMIPPGMPNPMAMFLSQVTSTEPMAFAATSAGNRAQIQVRIPLAPFIEIAGAAQGRTM
jgi:hypothetical protein